MTNRSANAAKRAAAILGKAGGRKRAANKGWQKISPARRSEIARKAVAAREAKRKRA